MPARTVTILSCIVLRRVKVYQPSSLTYLQSNIPNRNADETDPCETRDSLNEVFLALVFVTFVLISLKVITFEFNNGAISLGPKEGRGLFHIIFSTKSVDIHPGSNSDVSKKKLAVSSLSTLKKKKERKVKTFSVSSKPTYSSRIDVLSELTNKVNFNKRPELINSGNVSVVYKVFDLLGKELAVFKPLNMDIKQPLRYTSRLEVGNEIAAYQLDQNIKHLGIHAGVPMTEMATLPVDFFDCGVSKIDAVPVLGSLQQFVHNSETCEDYGASIYTVDDVHRIGILDVRILNCDRHSGNLLLVHESDAKKKLVPIDHALAFPAWSPEDSSLKNITYEWLMFPQSKVVFSDSVLQAITEINIENDLKTMSDLGMSFEQQLCLYASTRFLQLGAKKYNKTLFEIGSLIQRTGDRENVSVFEKVLTEGVYEVCGPVLKDHCLEQNFPQICVHVDVLIEKMFLGL